MRPFARPARRAGFVAIAVFAAAALAGPAAAEPIPLDASYGSGGVAEVEVVRFGELRSPFLYSVAVDDVGRAVLGTSDGVVRLDADGARDTGFGVDGAALASGGFDDFTVDVAAGGIVVGGRADDRPAIRRLTPDGLPDPRFGEDGVLAFAPAVPGATGEANAVAFADDGSVVALVSWRGDDDAVSVHRVRSDGTIDASFGADGAVWFDQPTVDVDGSWGLAVDGNDVLVTVNHVVEGTTPEASSFWFDLHRLGPDGRPDRDFGDDGVVRYEDGGSVRIAVDERDGSVLVGGAAGGRSPAAVWKLRSDGTPDRRFAGGGPAAVPQSLGVTWALAALPDGRIAVQADGGHEVTAILRPDGSPEVAFGDGGGIRSDHHPGLGGDVAVDAQGRLLVGHAWGGEIERSSVRRYVLDGLPSLAPAVTAIAVHDGSLSVSWVPADVELGSPVRSYLVAAFTADGGALANHRVVAGDVHQVSLPGIGNDRAYEVVVLPYDDLGPVLGSVPVVVAADVAAPAPVAAPGAVVDLAATAGLGFATATWSPPAGDGGAPIAGYSVLTVRTDTGALAAWRNVPADVRSLSVSGLADGVAHDVYVLAHSAAGFGAVADPVRVTPDAGGAAPQAPAVAWMAVAPIGSSHAVVTWGPQVEQGEAISRFHVVVIEDGAMTAWHPVPPSQRQAVVRAAAGAEVYVFTDSRSGWGPLLHRPVPG